MFLALSLQGGGIVALKRGDQALMIPALTPPFLANFIMAPFCSRITAGRFNYSGRTVQLAQNFPPEPHAIHGFGWQSLWRLEHLERNACTLVYEHDLGAAASTGWPWAFTARQDFVLSDTALTQSVSIINVSDECMPVGAGFHPYFPLTTASEVSMLCQGELVLDADGLPSVASASDPSSKLAGKDDFQVNPMASRPWLERGLDKVYLWRQGSAQICWPDQPWSLIIEPDSSLLHWVVYAPKNAGFICIEPISHTPDALNLFGARQGGAGGMASLAPGDHWSTSTRFVTSGNC